MNPSKTTSVGIGAAVYFVLSMATTYLVMSGGSAAGTLGGMLSCLVAIIAPAVAVWHYTTTHDLTIAPGPGAGIGAAASVIGALAAGALGYVFQAVGLFPSTAEAMARQRSEMIAQGMSAEEVDRIMSMAGGVADNPILGIVLSVAVGAVIGAIAGAIAAAVFKKGEPAML